MSCTVTDKELWLYADGEASSEQSVTLQKHTATCGECKSRLQQHASQRQRFVGLVDAQVGDLQPLMALQKIRQKIVDQQELSPWLKLRRAWRDLWAFNRNAARGLVFATAAGALCAPLAVMWAQRTVERGGTGAAFAALLIESVELENDTQAVVYQGEDGATALIWLAPTEPNGLQNAIIP